MRELQERNESVAKPVGLIELINCYGETFLNDLAPEDPSLESQRKQGWVMSGSKEIERKWAQQK